MPKKSLTVDKAAAPTLKPVLLQCWMSTEYREMIDMAKDRHARYAAQHGYDYIIHHVDENLDVSGCGLGCRMLEVVAALLRAGHPFVCRMDADAVIADMDCDLASALPGWAYFGVTAHAYPTARDPFHLNIGVAYWNNHPKTFDFIGAVLANEKNAELMNRMGFLEQGIINYLLLDERAAWQEGFCLLGHEWNANIHEGWAKNAHVAALHGAPDRSERFARYVRDLEGNPMQPSEVTGQIDLMYRLGRALACVQANDPAEAEWNFRVIVDRDKDQHEAVRHYAHFLNDQRRLEECLEYLEWTLTKEPDDGENLLRMALCYHESGMPDRSDAIYRRLLEHPARSKSAYYRWAYGTFCLSEGKLKEGWEGFEWAYNCNLRQKRSRQPEWNGSYMGADKRLYICVEMGMGDTILFERFVAEAKKRSGAWVILETYEQLVPVMLRQTFADEVVCVDRLRTFRAPFDEWVNIGSLPGVLNVNTLEELSGYSAPYLVPARRYVPRSGDLPRIGLVWRGNAANPIDSARSLKFGEFGSILATKGIQIVSLQYQAQPHEFTVVESNAPERALALPDVSTSDKLEAAIESCDLVIGIDTFVTNFACAMGKPTWVISRLQSDFRWGNIGFGRTTPWYPTATLFRQTRPYYWEDVTEAVSVELADFVKSKVNTEHAEPN